MISQSIGQLMSSLKELLDNGAYSDLEIRCGDDKHQVHKAIVCPRSKLLAELCDDDIISLKTDDPQAVELMLTYLYTLDYPQIVSKPLTNGIHAEEPSTPISKEYSREEEQFIETTPSEAGSESIKKKGKKKKRGSVQATNGLVDTVTEQPAPPPPPDAAPHANSNLVIHAKLYALGSKYGIHGLKTLSADKFEKEVEHSWESDDFLRAAQEAYTSAGDDRTIRDAVLNAMKLHPQLLDRKQVQDVIKRLELSFDLLMHMHSHSR